jgi:hypothetical protein
VSAILGGSPSVLNVSSRSTVRQRIWIALRASQNSRRRSSSSRYCPNALCPSFVPSQRQILLGAFGYGGCLGSIPLRLFRLLGDKRGAYPFWLFKVGAARGLPGNQITRGHTSKQYRFGSHTPSKSAGLCRKTCLVDGATALRRLLRMRPLFALRP